MRALAHRGDPVTVHDAARLAGVSHSWLYQQPQLLAEINRLRELPPSSRGPRARASQRATVDSRRQQLHAYREEITRLRAENKALTEQLAHYLGATRATTPYRRPAGGELLGWQKEFNAAISRIRSTVEREIANWKTWRITHTDYRRPEHTYQKAFNAVRALHFFKLQSEF